jgi:hypothetical protein
MTHTARDAALHILETLQAVYATPLEFVPARAPDFPHLDLPAYAASRAWMQAHGFRHLVDLEMPALTNNPRTLMARSFTRAYAANDGTAVAEYYQFMVRRDRLLRQWLTGMRNWRWIAATRFALGALVTRHCTGFETEFDDGGFVVTSNAESAAKITAPPSMDILFLPHGTDPGEVLAAHRARVAARSARLPDARPMPVADVRQMLAQQRRMAEQKSAWRAAQEWVSKAEIDAMSSNPAVADEVFAELRKLRAGATPGA